jgi:hypothetical protein
MNKSLLFPLLAIGFFISSCSKQIYSHEQVMQSYHTKEDVVRQFEQPDEKRALNDTLQWLYNCDSSSNLVLTKTKVKIYGTYNSAAGFHSVPRNVNRFSPYKKYVKFTFGKEGNVLSWNSSGVNFAERKSKTLATVAIVVGSAIVVALVVGPLLLDDLFDDFQLAL